MRQRVLRGLGVVTAVLLVACPIRNLLYLRGCFGAVGVPMDLPASEARLGSGRQPRRLAAAGIAWLLVAVGGLVWDKALGEFAGVELPPDSVYACLLDHRSGHTHSALTNGPLLGAAVLAIWVFWELWSQRHAIEPRRTRR